MMRIKQSKPVLMIGLHRTHLHAWLRQADPQRELLAHEDVRIVGLAKLRSSSLSWAGVKRVRCRFLFLTLLAAGLVGFCCCCCCFSWSLLFTAPPGGLDPAPLISSPGRRVAPSTASETGASSPGWPLVSSRRHPACISMPPCDPEARRPRHPSSLKQRKQVETEWAHNQHRALLKKERSVSALKKITFLDSHSKHYVVLCKN